MYLKGSIKLPQRTNQKARCREAMKIRKKWLMTVVLIVVIACHSIGIEAAEIQENGQVGAEEEETMPEADTEIIFDADAAVNKSAAKSALADMHGVFVFRNAFITQEKLVKESQKREREEIENLILTSHQPELAYEDYYKEESSNLFLWVYCGIVSVCILCGAIMVEDYLKKRKAKHRKTTDKTITFVVGGDNFGEGSGMD